jgi:hypothetical protein
MRNLQFSISTLLIGTAAAATWLSVILVFSRSAGNMFVGLIQLLTLCSGTLGIHAILQKKSNAWTISALISGLLVLLVLYILSLQDNPIIRFSASDE